jgi:ABC-type transporter Mla MlaB component
VEARMFRISVERFANHHETLRLEGHLVGPWLGQLQLSCEQVLGEGKQLTLDLTAVSFADRDGVALLRELKVRGVAITNCSPFIAHQLKDEGR